MSKGFDELLTFPTLFIYRVIAYQGDAIEAQCSEVLKTIFGKIEAKKTMPSKTGKFLRVHITVKAVSGDQLYKGYDALQVVEGVRMVF
jgi:putative lipoic acid-binding regulatory protein